MSEKELLLLILGDIEILQKHLNEGNIDTEHFYKHVVGLSSFISNQIESSK